MFVATIDLFVLASNGREGGCEQRGGEGDVKALASKGREGGLRPPTPLVENFFCVTQCAPTPIL